MSIQTVIGLIVLGFFAALFIFTIMAMKYYTSGKNECTVTAKVVEIMDSAVNLSYGFGGESYTTEFSMNKDSFKSKNLKVGDYLTIKVDARHPNNIISGF